MEDLQKLTLGVCEIARKVGQYLRTEREQLSLDNVEQKHAHDYVSYVDKNSEKQLVEALKSLPLQAGFVTEEQTASYHHEDYCWVVDPLDGTTNYIHHYAPYAISIGLRSADEILLGVVYEVNGDECFYAWKGGGAYVNGKPLSVNKQNDISQALLCIELPYNVDLYSQAAHHLIHHFYGLAGGIRMNGSAATALCYVAAGRLDGWLEKYIGLWDFTAGALIVQEAGGEVTNFTGSRSFIDGDDIIASNGIIHSALVEEITKAMKL